MGANSVATRVLVILSVLVHLAGPSDASAAPLNGVYTGVMDECPYRTFATRTDIYPEDDTVVDPGIVRDIEGIFADQLEAWGWRRMDDASAAFVLQAQVTRFSERSDMVQGVVQMDPGSTTHRDFLIALMDGAFPEDASNPIYSGVILTSEFSARSDAVSSDARSTVVEDGQALAVRMEEASLDRLCTWRLVEDIRARLLREMMEARKRERQRKELKIRADETQ